MTQAPRNPYSPPASDVRDSRDSRYRSPFWLAYFAFWVVLMLAGIALLALANDETDSIWMDVVDLSIYLCAAVGLFGFCFFRPILTQSAWKAFAPTFVAWDLWMLVRDEAFLSDDGSNGSLVLATALVVAMLLTVPAYVALFRYGFAENKLWATHAAGDTVSA